MEFLKAFKSAQKVSTPLITVRTFDNQSTVNAIKSVWTDDKENVPPMIIWDCINGFRAANDKGSTALQSLYQDTGASTEITIDLTESLRICPALMDDTLVFLYNMHLQWSEAKVIQAVWNLRDIFKAHGCMLLMLTNQGAILPLELSHDVLVLDEPLPTETVLQTIITDTFEYAKLPKPDSETLESATRALIGLPAFPAEQSVAMCIDTESEKLDIDGLWERKRQTINQTNGLSISSGNESLDSIGGLENLKTYMHRVMQGNNPPRCIIFTDEIEKQTAGSKSDSSGVKQELIGDLLTWSEDVKMGGVLELGVPGAGKSQLAKAIGATYNVPFIRFNFAAMQSSLVGSSGANLRTAIATVNAVSSGKILWIATCNSIDSLPTEFQSRFRDGIFFFDLPSEIERQSIWKIHREKYHIDSQDIIPHDSGWTGREIEECCSKAYRLRLTLSEASRYVIPVAVSNAALIDELRRAASGKYLSASTDSLYVYHDMQTSVNTVADVTGRKIR